MSLRSSFFEGLFIIILGFVHAKFINLRYNTAIKIRTKEVLWHVRAGNIVA